MKKKDHIKKNRALLLLARHMRRERQESLKDAIQLQSDKVRRVAKRLTKSPYIRIQA